MSYGRMKERSGNCAPRSGTAGPSEAADAAEDAHYGAIGGATSYPQSCSGGETG